MKETILDIVKQELQMTNRPEYTQALEEIILYSKNLDDTFEDNMKLYKKAKEAYVKQVSDS